MDLNKVTYLLALADTKNYSRAAEQCHISQPALTRYIKNLEEELNVTLFDRSSLSQFAGCNNPVRRLLPGKWR